MGCAFLLFIIKPTFFGMVCISVEAAEDISEPHGPDHKERIVQKKKKRRHFHIMTQGAMYQYVVYSYVKKKIYLSGKEKSNRVK